MFLELKTALAKDRKALVGLEYIEINKVLLYKCSLCDERGNIGVIISHLHSVVHHLNFLEADFPSVYESVRHENKEERKSELLEKVCAEIELRLGQLPPNLLTDDVTFVRSEVEHFKEEPSSTLVIDLIMMINAAQRSDHRSRSHLSRDDRTSSMYQRDSSSRIQWHKYRKSGSLQRSTSLD